MAPACAPTRRPPERKKKDQGRLLSHEESQQKQALGLSRGGLGTKINIFCEGRGLPISVTVTPGQQSETTQVAALLDQRRIKGLPGAPRRRFGVVAGDKLFDIPRVREAVSQRHSRPVIAHKRRPDGSYPPEAEGFDKALYRRRNVVERLISRLKEWRAIATRYEKLAESFVGVILLGFIRIWLHDLLSYRP
jgi:transposase